MRYHLKLVNPVDGDHQITIALDTEKMEWLVRLYGETSDGEATILDAVRSGIDPDWPVSEITVPMRICSGYGRGWETDMRVREMQVRRGGDV